MSFQPKRPASSPPIPPISRPATGSVRPSAPGAARPSTAPGAARPSTVRDARTEAHALGGGAVARPTLSPSGRKTIMLVDPDAGLRARMRSLLEGSYDVIEAKDGMEAVEMTSNIQPPALIVADTLMPRVDGFTLAKILRNNPVMKRVPIMFVSAQHNPQHVTQALVIGVSQYLPKSTPLAQVVEKIRKIAM
jgi:CheY-like chemotaxis protein